MRNRTTENELNQGNLRAGPPVVQVSSTSFTVEMPVETGAAGIGTVAEDIVDIASKDSFPASDPPPWTLGREPELRR